MPGGACRNLRAGGTECEAPRPAPQTPCALRQRLLAGCYSLVAWQLLSALSHAADSPCPPEVFLTPRAWARQNCPEEEWLCRGEGFHQRPGTRLRVQPRALWLRSVPRPAWKSLSGCTVAGVRIPCFQAQFPESIRNFEAWELYKPTRNVYFYLEGICLPVSWN